MKLSLASALLLWANYLSSTCCAYRTYSTPLIYCEATSDCDDNWYCDFSLGESGYCSPCSGFPIYASFCKYENGPGVLECMNICYPDSLCSSSDECSSSTDGDSYCNLLVEDIGLCVGCEYGPRKSLGYCEYGSEQKQKNCKSCFQPCTSTQDCPSLYFCSQENTDGSGYCASCDDFVAPKDCLENYLYPGGTIKNQTACLETCFTPCQDSTECFDPKGFCYPILADDSTSTQGYCQSCNTMWDDPEYCFLDVDNTMDLATEMDCGAHCFGECSEDSPCDEGYFCDFQSQTPGIGYCKKCSEGYRQQNCVFRYSTESQALCAESCTCYYLDSDADCLSGWV